MDERRQLPSAGMLLVNKEKGWTSFDVTARLRGILHTRRIGHTGTLDPEAEGVLPVLYGKATRLMELLSAGEKTYRAVLRLGVVTDTQDMTGRILETCPDPEAFWDPERIRRAIAGFEGEQTQIPPMYSALKVHGKKLYELAREGVTIERNPRQIFLRNIRVSDMSFPLVTFEVTCSKGTYIRTLCHDIGERLGCGGTMESLVRSRVGTWNLENCHTIAEIDMASREGRAGQLILTPDEILSDYPALTLPSEMDRLLLNGNPLGISFIRDPERLSHKDEPKCCFTDKERIRVYTSDGILGGLYEVKEDRGQLFPVKMLL